VLRDSGASLSGVLVGDENYSNPDGDPEGPWTLGDLTCNKTAKERPNLFYDLVDPATGNVFKCNPKRVWAYEPEKIRAFIKKTINGRWLPKVRFPVDPNKRPQLKKFLSERKASRRPLSSWLETSSVPRSQVELEKEKLDLEIGQVCLNAKATRLLDDILGERVVIYPKPVELIKVLAEQATSQEHGVLLDFFAGSGTTGHAVINLNREDGGRRCYLVDRGRIDHGSIVIIWRETEGWQKPDFERDKKFVAEQKLTEGADEVFINGDSFIPGARALEPIFKARMFAPMEA